MVDHPILLRGPGLTHATLEPVILQSSDQALIPVLLEELKAADGLQKVLNRTASARDDQGRLKLFQPIQRVVYIILVEAVCAIPGTPRLDPEVIESAGLVVRRIGSGGALQAWMQRQKQILGWVPLQANESDQDPDPALRRKPSTGNPLVDRELALRQPLAAPLEEDVTPLFVAPPAVCEALGKTLLYGVIPVTSSDVSEIAGENGASSPIDDPATYKALVNGHLFQFFKSGGEANFALAGTTISSDAAKPGTLVAKSALDDFISAVRQMAIEFDAFGTTAHSQTLLAELNNVSLDFAGGRRQGMGDFLRQARDVLVERNGQSIIMPLAWPKLSPLQAERILQAIVGGLTSRLVASSQGEGRFEQSKALYVLRTFVRVNRQPTCPPQLYWSSKNSEPYRIAEWYESPNLNLPLPQIALPNLFDRNLLKQLKPNVAFRVPEELFGLLNGMDAKAVVKGDDPGKGKGFGLDWICSFSLPIITFCAFIVINIFLSLFDIIFQWMLFIKICIPVPKKT
ncbi:MAG: hypothetical protein U0175_25640 [Caldilineaceae bacterium]